MEKVKLDTIMAIGCLEGLKQLADNSIQCCVTSPPYWRMRNYNVAGQLGLEDTLEQYVNNLVEIFDEVRRVLCPDGTFWLNLGDGYWGSGMAGKDPKGKVRGRNPSKNNQQYGPSKTGPMHPGIKAKDLMGLPWTVAFALRSQGWWLRQEIIWHKRNAMPESVTDRCTRTHEHIFMFSKSPKYYYNADAIKVPPAISTVKDIRQYLPGAFNPLKNYNSNATNGRQEKTLHKSHGPLPITSRRDKQSRYGARYARFNERWNKRKNEPFLKGVNRRSVWDLPCRPFKGNHFATFPVDLPELCIKAGSRKGDIILDPFMGAGTTALAAVGLQRHYIGFELNPEYVTIALNRMNRK